MIIGSIKETNINETRAAITPAMVKSYTKFGFKVILESKTGDQSFISDQEFLDSGAEIVSTAQDVYSNADIIIQVNPINIDEIDKLKDGSLFISLIQTTKEIEFVKKLTQKNVSAISMHLIPRSTIAQKMDALSSQSNIAGYKAVLSGAMHIGKYMPLLMTAAGTIPPAKVVVIGAGVAGLQAIATAKRLGAQE